MAHDEPDLAAQAPFALHVVGPQDHLADAARRLEADVFFETFGNTREMLEAEYAPVDDVSAFIVVVDRRRDRVAGMIRLTVDGHGRLKSLEDIAGEPWKTPVETALDAAGLSGLDIAQALDVTTLAVDPEYRSGSKGGLVSISMYAAVTQIAKAGGFRWLVTILDVVVLDLINGIGHDGFKHYPGVEPMAYLDSPSSVPVWCDLVEHEPRMRAAEPELAATMFDGEGLEAAVAPGDYERGGAIARALSSTGVIDLRDPDFQDIDLRDPALGDPALGDTVLTEAPADGARRAPRP